MNTILSKQQTKCLTLLSQGMTAREIASVMNLSSRTVESYLALIKKKIGKNRRSEIVRFFMNE